MENSVKEKVTVTEWLVFILFLVIGLEELLACAAIKLGSSFDVYYKQSLVVVGMTAVTVVLFLLINLVRYIKNKKKHEVVEENYISRYNPYMWIAVVMLAIIGITSLWCVEDYSGADLTLEYMNSVQGRNQMFSYNPLTGSKLQLGIYPKYKFAALPYFYASIARFFAIKETTLVCIIVPSIVLLAYVAICLQIGRMLFPERKGRSLLFLSCVLILLVTGDGWRYTASHGLLHEGWKGSTIVGCLVVPFVTLTLHRIFFLKQRIYGMLALLAALATTLYCRQLYLPKIWTPGNADFGHQIGVYFGALVILLCIRQRYPAEDNVRDGGLLFIFALTMLFPYSGLTYPAIAYVCCKILDSMGKYSGKRVVVVGGVMTFMLAGTILPFRGGYNFRHIRQTDTDIAASISQVNNPVFVGPNEMVERARMYLGCKTPYGKNLWIADCGREVADGLEESEIILYENINVQEKDAGIIGLLAKTAGCNVFYATPDMFALTGQEAWDSADPELKKAELLETLCDQGWEKYIDRDDYYIFIRRNN